MAVHVPTLQAIDATLVSDPKLGLLGMFADDDTDVEAICIYNTIYLPAPFLGSSGSET